MDLDCRDAARPICDASACRGCKVDSECPSGACGDDGVCAAEVNVVYLAANGVDIGTCTRSAPCKGVKFGLSKTSASRNHVVLAPGTYTEQQIAISSSTTSALSLAIHGGGATLSSDQGDGQEMFAVSLPASIRDLEIVFGPFGSGITVNETAVLERLNIRAPTGILVRGPATVRDVFVDATLTGIAVQNSVLTLDRATLKGGSKGITAASGATVEVSNTLVFGTSNIGIDLASDSGGSISFVTIVDTGTSSTTVAGLSCSAASFPVHSTIVWTPGSTRPAATPCGFVSTIAGPVGAIGATNIDPLFVGQGDYHLDTASPARDMVDEGPEFDFEGDPRPNGARFDIGADETTGP
jgi:hypothetical protein